MRKLLILAISRDNLYWNYLIHKNDFENNDVRVLKEIFEVNNA